MRNLSAASARAKFERLAPDLELDGYSMDLYRQLRLSMTLLPMKVVLEHSGAYGQGVEYTYTMVHGQLPAPKRLLKPSH